MTSFVNVLQQGNSWLFIPSAVLLGALHGLEPGHSKTMMAAFIVAIRGTLAQAVLLGLAATLSHTAIVWAIALGGLYFGSQWSTGTTEPYFQLVSAVLIVGVALWMLWRTWRHRPGAEDGAHGHDHDHVHDHDHSHANDHGHAEARRIDTGHGIVRLQIFEQGVPPRFRLYSESGVTWLPEQAQIETERADGSRQTFTFRRHGGYLESVQEVPEPHEFVARLRLGKPQHSHDYDVEFVEHGHRHVVGGYEALDLTAPGYQDPHELAHANDIRRRFASRHVTTSQIVIFALGATLVLCFSIGLALTMVTSGAIAALGVKHAARHFSGFGELARKAPYVSGTIILMVGLYVGY